MHQINSPLSTGGCGPAGRCSSLDDSTTSTHQTLPWERLPSWDGLWTALWIHRHVCQHLSSTLCSGWNTTTKGFCPCASSWERFNDCSLQSAVPSAKYVVTAVDTTPQPAAAFEAVSQAKEHWNGDCEKLDPDSYHKEITNHTFRTLWMLCGGTHRTACGVTVNPQLCTCCSSRSTPVTELLLGRCCPGVSRAGISVPQSQQDKRTSLTPLTFLPHFWAPSILVVFWVVKRQLLAICILKAFSSTSMDQEKKGEVSLTSKCKTIKIVSFYLVIVISTLFETDKTVSFPFSETVCLYYSLTAPI